MKLLWKYSFHQIVWYGSSSLNPTFIARNTSVTALDMASRSDDLEYPMLRHRVDMDGLRRSTTFDHIVASVRGQNKICITQETCITRIHPPPANNGCIV